MYITNTINV